MGPGWPRRADPGQDCGRCDQEHVLHHRSRPGHPIYPRRQVRHGLQRPALARTLNRLRPSPYDSCRDRPEMLSRTRPRPMATRSDAPAVRDAVPRSQGFSRAINRAPSISTARRHRRSQVLCDPGSVLRPDPVGSEQGHQGVGHCGSTSAI